MKLSTFAKLVRKNWIAVNPVPAQIGKEGHCKQGFICSTINRTSDSLINKTKNIKLKNEYREFEKLCLQFVSASIPDAYTVYAHLLANNMPCEDIDVHNFRLALLNDMIDWATQKEGK